MLSILVCYSLVPVLVYMACIDECFEKALDRHPKYQMKLWMIASVVILLAIDFAETNVLGYHTGA